MLTWLDRLMSPSTLRNSVTGRADLHPTPDYANGTSLSMQVVSLSR